MTSLSLMLSLEVRVTDHATVNFIGPARRKTRRASSTPMPTLEMTRSTCAYPTAFTWSPTCPYESSYLNGDIPTPSIAKYMERIGKSVGLSFGNDLNRAWGRNDVRSRRITSSPP